MRILDCSSLCDWCNKLLHDPTDTQINCKEGRCLDDIAESMDERFLHYWCYEDFFNSKEGEAERNALDQWRQARCDANSSTRNSRV